MSNSLKVLVDNRDALLLAEVAAWLHNYEKCSDKHLRGTTHNPPSGSVVDPAQYLSLLGKHTIHLLEEDVDLIDLIKEFSSSPNFMTDPSKEWLIRALGFCHSVAHTEKADRVCFCSRQNFTDLHYSSPFGYDSSPSIDNVSALTDRLESLLNRLISLLPDVSSKRSLLREDIKNIFGSVLADTRRPLNEVTLWDWSNMVAAFYKAAIAQVLIDGPVEPPTRLRWRLLGVRIDGVAFSQSMARIPDLEDRQDILTDGFDKVRVLLEDKYPLGTEIYRDTNGSIFIVPNIPHLLNLKNGDGESLSYLITRDFNTGTVKEKVSLKLGDELVPALELDPHKQAWSWDDSASHHDPLPIFDHFKQPPASCANQATVRSWWQDTREDICTVCQLRPQGGGAVDNKDHYHRRAIGVKCLSTCQTCKALERKVCAICEDRRADRSERWAGDLKTTIWIDEVADANGKLALIAGKFNLQHWLDGTKIFYPAGREDRKIPARLALKIRNMGPPLNAGQILIIQRNEYTWNDSLAILESPTEIEEEQIPRRFKIDELQVDATGQKIKVTDVQKLPDGHYRIVLNKILVDFAIGDSCRIRGRYFQVVEDGSQVEATSEDAIQLVEDQILHPGYLMVEQATRAYSMEEAQTPARVYRVWQTTLQFWQDLKDNLDIVDKISPRLRIQVAFSEEELRERLVRFHTYEIKLRDINLSVVKVGDYEFITADNLQRAAILLNPSRAEEYRKDYKKAADYVDEQLRISNEPIKVELPTGYGKPNEPLGQLDILTVKQEDTCYIPAIFILIEPHTFMVVVPADKALQVMHTIKGKYDEEIGKVRNRLPLTTGIVFAGARRPLSAILDAGRRILRQPTPYEQWKISYFEKIIESPNRGPWPSKVDVTLEKDEHTLLMRVPTVMGNKKTPDEWYPYWHMEAPFPDRWVLASDLGEGNVVSFMPSRFDFEFLDTAARRFEISYDNGKRRGAQQPGSSYHAARPYYLEQLDEFEDLWTILSQGLETTQIHTLISIIEDKRMEWNADQNNETFKQIVCDALNNASWKSRPKEEQFKQVYRAALSGQLTDVVELYLHILTPQEEADTNPNDN